MTIGARDFFCFEISYMCPISGCHNFGGRGYARSTFVNHLNTHCRIFLTNESERTWALQATSSFGNLKCCGLCSKLDSSASGRLLCKKCSKQTREYTVVKKNLPQAKCTLLTSKIRDANKTELKTLSEIPTLLRRHWSKCVSTTLALLLSAKTDTESWKALEVWTKLKSVLVLPLKGGTKRRQSTYKLYEKRMLLWIAGHHDLCWTQALDLEQKRTKKRNAARSKKLQLTARAPTQNHAKLGKALKKKYAKAKLFVKVGEYSQAMTSLPSTGTAPIKETVLRQLHCKHPKRNNPILWPKISKISEYPQTSSPMLNQPGPMEDSTGVGF